MTVNNIISSRGRPQADAAYDLCNQRTIVCQQQERDCITAAANQARLMIIVVCCSGDDCMGDVLKALCARYIDGICAAAAICFCFVSSAGL